MAEAGIDNLISDTPQSDSKRQKLFECILTRNSKLYLGKVYTEEQVSDSKVFREIYHQYVFNGSLCSFRNK